MRPPRAIFRPFLRSLPFLLVAAPGTASAQVLTVASVSPAPNSVGASTAAPVVLTFNLAIDPATATAANFGVLGRWSGVVPGAIAVSGAQVTFTPQRPYFPGELVSVGLSNKVKATTGQALVGGYHALFWARAGASANSYALDQVVEFRLPGEGLIRTYGFFAGDVDRDGSPDMTATNEVAHDIRLLKNDGCTSFGPKQIFALPAGSEPSPNEGSDLNGDGFLDLVTGNQSSQSVAVFLNDAGAGFHPPVSYATGDITSGVALIDADGDGDVDVLGATFSDIELFHNDGSGVLSFSKKIDGGGSGEWQIAVADANGDGHSDVFACNRFSSSIGLVTGDGQNNFALSDVKSTGGDPWPIALGDIDLDGDVDAVAGNSSNATAAVLRGDGAGHLLPAVLVACGNNPVACDLADLDGDGDLDLSVACFSSGTAFVYRNNGGTFGNAQQLDVEIAASCSVLADFDRDGDCDIAVTDELADKSFMYRQLGPTPAGVQAPTCDATLRVNNFALRAGFGAQPPEPLPLGATAFFGVTGQANKPWMLLAGIGVAPGAPTAAGLYNLNPATTLTLLNGFVTPGLSTNGFGESVLGLPVPGTAPVGIAIALQGAVAAAGAPLGVRLTNPETVVATP